MLKQIGRGVAAAAVAAVGLVARQVLTGRGASAWPRHAPERDDGSRWHVVTVYRPAPEVPTEPPPEPLARLGDRVEVRVRPAPDDKGTELAARLRDGGTADQRGHLRAALREAKQVLETGEVLQPDYPPTTRPTPLNKPLRLLTSHGREGGLA